MLSEAESLNLSTIARHVRAAGRLRLAVPGLEGNEILARRIETYVRRQPGVEEVKANPRTGRVLIRYAKNAPIIDQLEKFAFPKRAPEAASTSPDSPPAKAQPLLTAVVPLRPAPSAVAWHALSCTEVLERLATTPDGLSESEAERRLAANGANLTQTVAARTRLQLLGAQLNNLPTGLLLGSAALSLILGDLFDAGAIVLVVGVNAAIGYHIERKSEDMIASWRKLEAGDVRVLRGGNPRDIPAAELVAGDVLLCQAGDVVPADARVIDAHRLFANEAPLTGESEGQAKQPDPVPEGCVLAERRSMLYAGTGLLGGHGRAIVVGTGRATELASVRDLIENAQSPETPLEKQLSQLGRRVSWIGIAAAGVTAAAGIVRRQPLVGLMRGAVALAVAAIPEGLPVVATAALVRSMGRMRKEGMIVRRVAAAETLGGVTVVCADKTGTLTMNEMRLEVLDLRDHQVSAAHVTADGHDPLGNSASRLLTAAVLNSDVDIQTNGHRSEISGSATEKALLTAAGAAGLQIAALRSQFPRRLLRERHDGVHHVYSLHDSETGRLAFLKGAPEQVLPLCERDETGALDAPARQAFLERNATLAAAGYRVLAFAWQRLAPPSEKDAGQPEEPTGGYEYIGLAGLRDPLRAGAAEAVREAERAGIRTLILTGDQKATAAAIARQVGLGGETLDGAEIVPQLRSQDPAALARLKNVSVLARVTPADKLAVVEALRASGEVVAMVGDGINDAPALKAADVGIAVGVRSSDLARQTADVVLVKEDLRSVLAAVGEGRIVQDNLRRAVRFLFATNLSEIALMLGGALLGRAPLTPLQLLWVNLLTDTLPAMALALEPGDPNVLGRPPASPHAPLLSKRDWGRVIRDGSLMGGLGGVAFLAGGSPTAFATLTAAQLGYGMVCRASERPLSPRFGALVGGAAGLQLAAMLLPPLRGALRLAPANALSLAGFATGLVLPWATKRVAQVLSLGGQT